MRWLIVLLCFLSVGCGTWPMAVGHQLKISRHWARDTQTKAQLGPHGQNDFAPLLTKDLIVVGNGVDGIVAYDRKSQAVRWRMPINGGVEAGAVIDGDSLYFGASDGLFYCVNTLKGTVNWTYPIRSEGLARPFFKDGVIYFLAGNNIAYALDAKTGKLRWLYTRRDQSNLSIRGGSQPNVFDGIVYLGFSDGNLVALKEATGSLVWETTLSHSRRFRDVDAHPVVDGIHIFVTSYDGAIYCLNRKSGKVIWHVDGGGDTAVTLSGEHLYYSSSSGDTVALDKSSGKVLWSVKNPIGMGGRPTLYGDLLLVGQLNGPLLVMDPQRGSILGEYDTGWGIAARPVIDPRSNEVLVLSAGANLYGLGIGWQRAGMSWPWEH